MRRIDREKQPNRAYLIRCWQEGKAAPGKAVHWRFSVEEVLHERHRRGFDSLKTLIAFLEIEFSGKDAPVEAASEEQATGIPRAIG